MYKLSKYIYESDNIDSDPKLKGKRFLFSTRSSLSLLVSEKTLKQLRINKFDIFSSSTLSKFEKYKIIVPADCNEFEDVVKENNRIKRQNTVLALTIQPTSNCQFRCYYCGQEHINHQMDEDVEDYYLRRIENVLEKNSGKYKMIYITWYGGEPILGIKQIRSFTTKIKSLCNRKKIDYDAEMITNGYLLNKRTFLDLLMNYNVRRFQVTIDGTSRTHDKRRVLGKDKGATFNVIYNNVLEDVLLKEYEEKHAEIQIRINIDKTNYTEVDELLNKLIADRIAGKVFLSFAPIENWGGNDAGKFSFSLKEFSNLHMKWIKNCIDKHIPTEILIPNRTYYSCMVEIPNNEVYDAYGNTYPCWEFPYSKYKGSQYMISCYDDKKNKNNENVVLLDFGEKVISTSNLCSKCIWYPLCAGGCALAQYECRNACPNYKFNMTKRLLFDYYCRKSLKHEKIIK